MRSLYFLLLVCLANVSVGVGAERPNIILCMADDLGWGDVGFNGNTVIKTPELDAMAANGLKFSRFYAGAPVCSPTRGSALTGRHPFRYGIFFANTGHMRAGERTMAEMLSANGYRTGHFGKWHLGTLTRTEKDSNRGGPDNVKHYAPPWENGFEVCFSTEAKVPTWDPMIKPPGARSTWWNALKAGEKTVPYGTAYWNQSGKRVTENLSGANPRVIMDRVVPFVKESAKMKKPFFAVVWFHTPHLPVVAGPRFASIYSDHDDYARAFYGSITAMDEQIGRLRRTLREAGVADNTVLWFCSDNGPEGRAGKAPGMAGPFRGRKRDLFEGGIRVPGLMEWPAKIEAGRTTDFPASTLDYFPTILSVTGVKEEGVKPIDGVDLMPMVDGRMKKRPRAIGFQSRNVAAWTDNQFKLIVQNSGKVMLFDLLKDRGETHNLSEEHPEIVVRMRKELDAWRASCKSSLAGADYQP